MQNQVAPASVGSIETAPVRYVDWSAILGGAIAGAGVAFVLSTFGTGLGLSLVSPYRGEGLPAWGLVVGIGLWTLWVAGTSFIAAGYVTGRMRRRMPDASTHEAQIRDGVHGVIAWSTCALIGAALLALGAYGTGTVASRIAPAAANVAPAARATAARPGQLDEGDYTVIVEQMFGPGEENAKPGAEAARRVAAKILAAGVAVGKLEGRDRAYLTKLIASRSGIDEPTAQGRVDQAFKESQGLAEKVKQAANVARKVAVVSAFILAASLLLGLVAAWWAASVGGRHRDEQTVFAWLEWR